MKNLKIIYSITILLSGNIIIHAQKPFLDSIHIQIDDKTELELSVNNYENLDEYVEKDLKSLQSILEDYNEIPDGISYSVTFIPDKQISVKQKGQSERIIWDKSGQKRYQLNNQCSISSENYYLLIRFNEIESMVSDSLIIKIKEAIDSTRIIQGRFAATYNYAFQGDNLVHFKQLDKMNGQLDALNLAGGVGVNLIKNQPVIDLSAEIGLIFNRKGIWKNQYYLSYNQQYDFDDNSNLNLNGFLNAGYRYNLSNTLNNPNWLGLELGYLVSQHDDLYKQNTFRFGINWEIGRYMSVAPQLYLSGDLTEFYPAIRIGFGF